ncbi:MAG: YcxB family protein [Bacteroidota bacterium]
MEPLHLRYEQTPELSYDFANYYWQSRKVIRWGLWAMVGVIVLLGLRALLAEGEARTQALSWLIPLVLILGFWRVLIPYTMKRQIDRAAASHQQGIIREMIFREEGIEVKTETSSAVFAYEGIVQVGQSEKCYFLYIAYNQAMTLPKAAMNPEEEKTFLAILAAEDIALV